MSWNKNWRRNWRSGYRLNWRGPSFDAVFGGTTPAGVETFALDIENNYTVRFKWATGLTPTRSGLESRESRNTRAQERYSGFAWLLGDAPRDVRTTLAKYAVRGAVFLLALPHEELLLRQDADGAIVYVTAEDLELTDWAKVGQRVVVYHEDDDGTLRFIEAVIQAVGVDSITLNIAPGELGAYGGRIGPAKPIYFEPEQNFGRFESAAEQWEIVARAVDFDFARELASIDLGPLTTAAALEDAVLTAKYPGSNPTIVIDGDAIVGAVIHEVGDIVTVSINPSAPPPFRTTAEQLYAAFATSTLVAPAGTWGSGNLSAGDLVPATALVGGDAEGAVGTGATLEEHDGKPVWDGPIIVNGSVTDSIHALTQIIDMGGVLYAKGFADAAAWGRGVAMTSEDRYDWQWLKLFLVTVRGGQKSWWLPSWRDDLPFVSKAAGTITVEGDVGTWWPSQRQHIQVWEADDTMTRAEIEAAVNNGDGTWTLTIGTTLASSNVRMVSWLELCRFERDDLDVKWGATGFTFATVARVVQA